MGEARLSGLDRLDRNVVHEICTNQVVVTLQACVKELVENALDAEATRIEVRLRENGSELLEVVDNGHGIATDNYSKLATRHATSKIRDYDDLSQSLSTFGFRGEALSAICAMGDMTVCTRTANNATATLLSYDRFGKLASQVAAAREMGTTISIRDLFRRLPVRHREFIRNAKAQVSATLRLIQAYAIAQPHIRFHVVAEKARGHGAARASLLSTSGSSSGWLQAASAVLGDNALINVENFEMQSSNTGWTVSGLISTPDGGRRARDIQLFFCNRRPIDPPKRISKLITDTYHQYNSRMWPVVILAFNASQGKVDVNVTPDKRTVFLHNEEELLVELQQALTELFTPKSQSMGRALADFGIRSTANPPSAVAASAAAAEAEAASRVAPITVSECIAGSVCADPEAKTPQSAGDTTCPPSIDLLQPTGHSSSMQTPHVGGSLKRSIHEVTVGPETPEKPALTQVAEQAAFPANKGGSIASDGTSKNFWAHKLQRHSAVPNGTNASEPEVQIIELDTLMADPLPTCANMPQQDEKQASMGLVGNDDDDFLVMEELCPDENALPLQYEVSKEAAGGSSVSLADGAPKASAYAVGVPAAEVFSPLSALDTSAKGSTGDFIVSELQSPAAVSDAHASAGRGAPVSDANEARAFVTSATEPTSSSDLQPIFLATSVAGDAAPLLVPDLPPVGGSLQITVSMAELCSAVSKRRRKVSETASVKAMSTTPSMHFPSAFSLSSLQRKGQESTRTTLDEVAKFATGTQSKGASSDASALRFDKSCFSQMRVIGQFNLGFVIASLRADSAELTRSQRGALPGSADGLQLFIVDQHASDEKFRFESLNRESRIDRQPLVASHYLQLTPAQEQLAESHLEVFMKNGFELHRDESRPPGRRLRLASLPTCQGMVFNEKDIHDLLYTLEESESDSRRPSTQDASASGSLLDLAGHRALWSSTALPRPAKVWQLLACRACRGAIMIGKALRAHEMEKILSNLGSLEQPFHCPHGRPTMRHLVDAGSCKTTPHAAPPLARLLEQSSLGSVS
mmetsp:Transcript_88087/g.169516  ORF Transcript_88087/g.169516 Transcript_88087/m.169516 type:complete len:1035 (-) Transcript_88087:162-3266(-)